MIANRQWQTLIRRLLFSSTIVLGFAIYAVPDSSGQTLPALPQKSVDTSYPVQTGTTIIVPAGGDLQGALDQAQLGDTILLQAGATYSGAFTLSPKSGSGWIVVRTSAADSSLPAQGQRITPSYASVLPKIVATNSAPAIQTSSGAHHYRLVGLEITVASGVSTNYGLVTLGTDSQSSSQVPYSLVLDRVYIHGQSNANLRRGVALNSATSAVIDSYISDAHEAGADAQAIAGWNGPGPFKIVNNYLEGAGENVMFGGADPSITNLVPSDIEVRGNYFNKPVSWRSSSWTVKNLFELKNAQRVLVDGNVFEHNWPQAQNGFSILFTVRNQDGSAPWSVVQDVTFTHNIVRHIAAAVNILGTDDIHPSQQTKRILISNNLFDDVNTANWGGNGRLFQILDGTADITIDHNTGFHTGEVIAAAGPANARFTYRNNLSPNNQYGVAGDNFYGDPLGTLATYFPGAVFRRNILQGGDPSKYPADNFFPASMNDVGFVNLTGGDYRLATSSPYNNAGTDGKDVGADIDAVNAATAGVLSGTAPGPPPADTTPPSVSITAPANGATVSGTTTISANASDNVGVAGVQFLLDGSTLGAEDTAAPYTASWKTSTATNGTHTISAIARDAAGNSTTSAPITVTVNNGTADVTPPSVAITAPANGATVSGTTTISANASDNVGVAGVQFLLDGSTLGAEDTAAPYTASWKTSTATNGTHTISAIARDAAGNSTTSAPITVTVNSGAADVTPPSVAITAPANGATVSGTTTISANASDNVGVAGVQFLVDGSTLGAEDTSAPYSVSWDTTKIANGSHTLTAVARDAAGNTTTSAAVSATVSNAPPTQTPFSGTPYQVPGQFEAENFDKGGEGVAYHDMTPGNQGGLYRTTEDVDIISPYAGGYVVNNFQTGEWLEYTINATTSGTYRIEALVSSMYTTSQFHVEIDGTDKTGTLSVPNTGSWGTFQWVGKDGVSLTAGQHILRITANVQYFNLDAIRLSLIAGAQSPFTGTPYQVPGQFEAENFDKGGEGVAYHDLTTGNQGGLYRTTEDVDIISPYAGGYVVNSFQTGEWLEYTINATTSGTYRIEALVSSTFTTSQFHVEIDGTDKTGALSIPNTGSWGTFQWVGKDGISLTAGQHILRITADVQYFNLDAIRLSLIAAQSPFTGTPFQMPGQFEAENFDKGGEGVAYHDLTGGNQGGLYRTTEDVDIISPYAGGYVVNNFQTGEWLEYTINVSVSGTYRIEALVSSMFTTSRFHVEVDGTDKTGAINVPNTGAWTTFQWLGNGGISLSAGQHILRISSDVEYFNLDALRVTEDPIIQITPPSVAIAAPSGGATIEPRRAAARV